MQDTSFPGHRLRPFSLLLLGGVVAGSLDLLYAFTFWGLEGVSPIQILQTVSSGIVGQPAAAQGGLGTALLGLVAHYVITTGMVCTYYAVSGKVRELLARPIFFGALYGIFLYFFMRHVVVPLSAAPGTQAMPPLLTFWTSILVHAFGVGVPAAWFARAAHRALGVHS